MLAGGTKQSGDTGRWLPEQDVEAQPSCLLSLVRLPPLPAIRYNHPCAHPFTLHGCPPQYPMASPGGYQLVGRTLPIWNPFTRTGPFQPGKPWLLRNFDQVSARLLPPFLPISQLSALVRESVLHFHF